MKTIKIASIAATLGFAALSFNTSAADNKTVSVTQISSQFAFKLAQEAVNQCSAEGYKVSATVVDLSGNVVAQLRADGAGIHTLDSSRKKAFTVTSMKQPSGNLMKTIAEKPILQPLQYMNQNLLFLAGGVPVELNKAMIGAVGVGGAPGGHLDVACADAALKKLL
ncbi:heme-binding protein [Vibrio europaeus]|uniref:GlcG/HbpS family heme-binding protein n=1 Tax=Vibrio oreintalis group TaxID=1891919 RepID=UPI001EFD3475|nr:MULTISPECIES: heme-binding protein [Vibrio oreintalis group]MCG9583470.1 heme-binding protein [Vibrio tubiashii]MCG9617367.1 heme-binding protein [Vibrio tubiashii]MCG9686105.1 heme-binding protein [Vibrio tubiashii]MDC5808063.1 heme-binding protein [Vibrio europaeus]MDC5825221.1 heme-binding protein [Vibrio europaeus]